MTNKYKAVCSGCGSSVPAGSGILSRSGKRWVVRHVHCSGSITMDLGYGQSAQVNTVRFSSGHEAHRNVNGRCEDAPCCGCCTI
jgi:hypothetical protein